MLAGQRGIMLIGLAFSCRQSSETDSGEDNWDAGGRWSFGEGECLSGPGVSQGGRERGTSCGWPLVSITKHLHMFTYIYCIQGNIWPRFIFTPFSPISSGWILWPGKVFLNFFFNYFNQKHRHVLANFWWGEIVCRCKRVKTKLGWKLPVYRYTLYTVSMIGVGNTSELSRSLEENFHGLPCHTNKTLCIYFYYKQTKNTLLINENTMYWCLFYFSYDALGLHSFIPCVFSFSGEMIPLNQYGRQQSWPWRGWVVI